MDTIKDMTKNLAYLCAIFNCSEGLDYKLIVACRVKIAGEHWLALR